MNITELFDLTSWLETELKLPEVINLYQQLQAVLQRNAQPSQPKQPFEGQKDALINSISAINLQRLTIDQLSFLSKLNIAQYIGKEGVANIEDILFKNVIDIATAAQKFAQIIQDLNAGQSKARQIKEGLTGCVEIEQHETDTIILRVNFSHKAAMANISDFKRWGNIWYDIGRGISMAHNSSPETIKIIGAKSGSVIIEMAVFYGIAKTTSMIILEALQVADKVLDIRKKAEEVRGMKLANDKIARELDKEAENEKKLGIDAITNKVTKELKIKPDGDGDKIPALDKAIKNLVEFIEQGGEVDCVIPESAEASSDSQDAEAQREKIKQLRTSFEEIRLLEDKLRQIEHKED